MPRGQERSGLMTATRADSLECVGLELDEFGSWSLFSQGEKDSCFYVDSMFEDFWKKTSWTQGGLMWV